MNAEAAVRYKQTMTRHAPLLCVFAATALVSWAQGPPESAAASSLRIRVVEGDAAINSIRFHRARDPVVQVLDRSGQPVAGATVTFLLPASGAGGTFENNGLSLTTQTDSRGMAAAHGLRPNNAAGQFRIRVTASSRGEAANTSLAQTNVEPVKKGHGKTIALVALVGGAAVGGALAAAGHGGSGGAQPASLSSSSVGSSAAGATIVPGAPVIGPPH